MIVVELIRLVIVLSLTAAGYQLGKAAPDPLALPNATPESSLLTFSVVGAGIGYVIGGAFGRGILAAIGRIERRAERVSGAVLLVGALGVLSGTAAALIIAWPIVILVPIDLVAYPVVALLFIILGFLGFRIAVRKRADLLEMMGLAQKRDFSGTGSSPEGPKILDTSAIIDGRIIEVANSGFFTGHVICPRFVLAELQAIADSSDESRRSRGRRGLQTLETIQSDRHITFDVGEDDVVGVVDVDAKLIAYTKKVNGVLVTTDFNLHKAAELQGVPVLNINNLASSLKPVVLPGEVVEIKVLREGSQSGQGVGYLEDGTMVVVESASEMIGETIPVSVTSVLQTSSGRMIFGTHGDVAARG